jgi:integrase
MCSLAPPGGEQDAALGAAVNELATDRRRDADELAAREDVLLGLDEQPQRAFADEVDRLVTVDAATLATRSGRPLFCVIDGPTRGRPWSPAAVRAEFRRVAARSGVRRRFAPHQLRHAHALELAREGVPLNIIQRQLGHTNLGTTSIYLQGIDPEEIITAVRARRAPMMSASAGLRL